MKILSFVIPAYNCQQYLKKCVTSMLAEEVLEDLEIIIVNDGSTDGTAAVCESLQARYPEVIRVLTQENRGHGGALNTGCAAAQGRYLKVIDADDWVNSAELPAFVQRLKTCKSDVVLTHHRTHHIRTQRIENWKCYPETFEESVFLDEILANWQDYSRSMRFHGITYRTAFYKKYSPGLPERVYYEDNFYAAFPCCYAGSIQPMDFFVYEYRIGDENQSVSERNQIRRIGQMEAVLRALALQRNRHCDGVAAIYAEKKLEELLLIYLSLALLSYPKRRVGREMARQTMVMIRNLAPELHRAVANKYRLFRLFSRLHLKKSQLDAVFASSLYRRLRGHRPLVHKETGK